MSELKDAGDGALVVVIGQNALTPTIAANPLVSRGIGDLARIQEQVSTKNSFAVVYPIAYEKALRFHRLFLRVRDEARLRRLESGDVEECTRDEPAGGGAERDEYDATGRPN